MVRHTENCREVTHMDENNNNQQNTQQNISIDYEKLASIIDGKQKVTEDSVMKGYFKQQGLSEDEMKQAISAFKEEKAKRTPNVDALQQQVKEANNRAVQAEMQMQAMTMASELGVSATKIPYLLKMADMADVVVDGKISEEKLKESLNKVLADLPELKTKTEDNPLGFKVGADGGQKANSSNEELARIFGVKIK